MIKLPSQLQEEIYRSHVRWENARAIERHLVGGMISESEDTEVRIPTSKVGLLKLAGKSILIKLYQVARQMVIDALDDKIRDVSGSRRDLRGGGSKIVSSLASEYAAKVAKDVFNDLLDYRTISRAAIDVRNSINGHELVRTTKGYIDKACKCPELYTMYNAASDLLVRVLKQEGLYGSHLETLDLIEIAKGISRKVFNSHLKPAIIIKFYEDKERGKEPSCDCSDLGKEPEIY
jgi:hypothetical protein